MYKTIYLIWPRKLDQSCVNQRQAYNLASDLNNQINISCYTELQALRLFLGKGRSYKLTIVLQTKIKFTEQFLDEEKIA